ncbi:hypothetical protein pb186bvf_008436 [Paramecium bursaria]
MYFLNSDTLKNRAEKFCTPKLDQLDKIYQELKVQPLEPIQDNDPLPDDIIDAFEIQEIFGLQEQLFKNYGQPTQICYIANNKKFVIIGTTKAVIICLQIHNGRVEKVQALFNVGNERYGPVTSFNNFGDMLLVGFFRGDIQIYEINKKWEKMQHLSQVHKSRIISAEFTFELHNKVYTLEALSFDDQGILMKHSFYIVTMLDKMMVKSSQDIIYENGNIKNQQKPPQISRQNSWWDSAKSALSTNSKDFDTQSTRSSQSFISKFQSDQKTILLNDDEDKSNRIALDMKIMPQNIANQLNIDVKKNRVVALQYYNRVDIIKIYADKLQCEIIYTLKRNNISLFEVNEKENGDMSWGQGYFNKSLQGALLLHIRWGETFHLVKLLSIENELEIVEGAVFVHDRSNSIIKSSFLTNNIIYVVQNQDTISFIHTTQFQFVKGDEENIDMNEKSRSLSKEEDLKPQQPDIEICYNHKLSQQATQIYNNGIVTIKQEKIYLQRLQTWKEFLELFLQKNKYLAALHSGMLIYQGTLRIIADIPSSFSERQLIMKNDLEKIGFTYILFILNKVDEKELPLQYEELCREIKKVFKYLIKTDNTQKILTDILDLFKEQGQLKLFFINLEQFIINKQIQQVSESFFIDLVTYYRQTEQNHMISKLILSLEIKNSDVTHMLKVCMDLQLYRPMIYLLNKQGDYITALIKLLDLWETKKQLEDNCKEHIQKQHLKSDREKVGIYILAYTRMCQKGINILGEKVPQVMFKHMLRGFMLFLFNFEIMVQFITIDVSTSLQLLLNFFQGRLNQIILSHDQSEQYINLKQYDDYVIANYPIELIQKMVQPIYLAYRQLQQITLQEKHYFAMFFSKLMIQYPFKSQFTSEIIQILLTKEYYNTLVQKSITSFSDQQEFELYQSSYLINTFIQSAISKKQMMEFQLQTNQYPELLAFLYFKDKKYQECCETYVQIQNQLIQQNLFEVIEGLLQDKKQKEIIQAVCIKLAPKIIQINQQAIFTLFKKYFTDLNTQKSIIQALEENPKIKMLYIRDQIISGEQVQDEIKLIYIELLCQTEPKGVLKELMQRNYPLDETLNYCKQYKIIDAMAFILQKRGQIQEALDMLSQIFFTKLRESHKNFAKIKTILLSDKQEIIEKLEYILNLCLMSQKEDIQYEGLWYQFLDNFFKEYKLKQLSDTKVPFQIRDLLCEIVSNVFNSMSKCVNLDVLIDKIELNYGEVPIRTFLQTNQSIKNKYEFESSIFKHAIEISKFDYIEQLSQYRNQMAKAVQSSQKCFICENNIDEGISVILFQCYHSYHHDCYIEQFANNSESFNSHKLKSSKIVQDCFVCLEDDTQLFNNKLLQLHLKRLGIDQQKYFCVSQVEPVKQQLDSKKSNKITKII